MSEELTEKETLSSVVKFLEHVLEHGTFQEIRDVNLYVSHNTLQVEGIWRKYWPEIIKEESTIIIP